jgi:hypothetical protein
MGARAATPCPRLPRLAGVSQPQCPPPPCATVQARRSIPDLDSGHQSPLSEPNRTPGPLDCQDHPAIAAGEPPYAGEDRPVSLFTPKGIYVNCRGNFVKPESVQGPYFKINLQ